MNLFVETRGEGRDLVLIHGWAMHSGIFAPLVSLLEPHFRLHLVDLPGHGRNRNDDGAVELGDWAARILDATPRGAVWVGWSLGGLVALQAALESAPSLAGLVVIAESPRLLTAPDWPHGVAPAALAEFGAALQRDYRRTIERFLALELVGSAHAQSLLRELRASVFARGEPDLRVLVGGLHLLETSDLRARLHELRLPSLWISGRRDRLIPSAAMRWSAQQTAGEYLELDAGHAPFLSHPQSVADAIAEFVRTNVQ